MKLGSLQPGAEIFDDGEVVETIGYDKVSNNDEEFTFNLSAKRQVT